MKKVLAIILSVLLISSLIVIPASASDIDAAIWGRKTDSQAAFTVSLENLGEDAATAFVYVATFEADTSFKNIEKYIVEIAAGEKLNKVYLADISEGTARVFVWNDGIIPLGSLDSESCGTVETLDGEKIDVTEEDVWASNTAVAANAVDGSISTKWSAEANDSITMYLGDDHIISSVTVDFDNTTTNYQVFVSEDGENFASVGETQTSSTEGLDVPNVRAKYVRVTVLGAVGINEISVYGFEDNVGEMLMTEEEMAEDWHVSAMDEMTYTDYLPLMGEKLYAEAGSDALVLYDAVGRDGVIDGEELVISSVTASQEPESANAAANVLDGDAATIWTASGVTDDAPATLVLDLGAAKKVSSVGIAFGNGSSRTYTYSVGVSTDNLSYTEVLPKTTAKSTDDIQKAYFTGVNARYVKLTFYARVDSSNNGWIRVGEVNAYGGDGLVEGAGGVLAQKELSLPNNNGDYEITFGLEIPSVIDGEDTSAFYSGVSLVDGITTGGADLDNHVAIQIKLDDSGDKLAIKQLVSNYFNEGSPVDLFENTFNKDEKLSFSLLVSPSNKTCFVTVSDSETTETQLVHFSYSDIELARNRAWAYTAPTAIAFNTGAGAKNKMTITDFALREIDRNTGALGGVDPTNGIVRLEATRLSSYPTDSGDYYGRYIYHNGADGVISVAADKNPAITRFVERRGLVGTGVSFEAVTMPGYFIVAQMGDAYYLKKFENTGKFLASATFYKENAENVGYYTGSTYTYRSYLQAESSEGNAMEDKYLYDTTSDYKTGDMKPWKMLTAAQGTFYLRSEGTAYASDNFYGDSISSQWWTNYPWKSNNPTNDSYNFTALITKNNVIVENGELLLKATQIASNAWPTDTSGETGKQYNGDFGRTDWVKWQGYVGVVSIQDKVYNKQCYLEGSFKQPDSPIGYWNAFWLTGRDSWPPEIDIFETLSSKYGHYAWHTAIHGEGDTNNLFGKQTSSINVATSYHTFALDWGYDYVKFYVDGKLFQRGHNNDTINFQKNMRLILNTGIGGWENEPDDTMVWNDGLRCQYIRSFQY